MSVSPKLEENSEVILPRRFHPGSCLTCYELPHKGAPLMRCSQCQLVSYCSKICQKKDWPTHRSFCIVNKIQDGKNIFSTSDKFGPEKNWLEIRTSLMMVCGVNLKRKLFTYEKDIFLFPRVCDICKESDASLLTECERCHSVFYCSIEHFEEGQKYHNEFCQDFLLNLKCDIHEGRMGAQDLPFPSLVDDIYQHLPSSFVKLMKMQNFIDDDKISEIENIPEIVEMALVSERLSYPLSLLFALEKVSVGMEREKIYKVQEMRVHVIGALSSKELLGIIRWEYFLHRLPSLMKVHFVFIGPELFTLFGEDQQDIPDKHCIDESGMLRCDNCQKNNRIVVYEMAAMTYAEYSESMHFSQPDAIIAYNCGFHEFLGEEGDLWKDSLDLIINGESVPLIFTSYTELEAKLDLKAMQKLGNFQIEISSMKNPFASLRPHLDSCKEENGIFFSNGYITSIRGKH